MKVKSGHKERFFGKRHNRTKRIRRKSRVTQDKFKWGVNIRLYPDKSQLSVIKQHCGARRYVWNDLVEYLQKHKKETNLYPTDKQLTERFNKTKSETKWLSTIHSKCLQQVLIDFKQSVRDCIKGVKGEPTFKSKKNYDDSCRLPVDAFRYVKGNRISFTKKIDDMHFKCSRKDERLLNKFQNKVRSSTLKWKPSGVIEASILLFLPFLPKNIFKRREEFLSEGNILTPSGNDLGLKDILIESDGTKHKKIDLKKEDKRYKKLQKKHHKKLNRSKKVWKSQPDRKEDDEYRNSKRAEKTRMMAAKAVAHMANIRKNRHESIALEVNIKHNFLSFEDLAVKNLMKNHKLAKSFADQGLYSLLLKIKTKADWLGNELVKVGRFYASTKTCSGCGFKVAKMTLDVREWDCPNCGRHHDRDINAAMNILNEGLRIKQEKQSGVNCNDTLPLSSGKVKHGEVPTVDDCQTKAFKASEPMNREGETADSATCSRSSEESTGREPVEVKLKTQTAGRSRKRVSFD